MTMRASMLLTADGRQAKAELRAVAGATEAVGTKARAAATGYDVMQQQAAEAAAAGRLVGQTHHVAAGSVANLLAQFNDIGVMMAAGQNPLQLAIQQGTQITQVLGPMGAGQAVRSLGAALMGMISPVNLITIGSIAAGAAMVQWLTSSADEALSLVDAVDALEEGIKEYREAAEVAGLSTFELEERFGSLAGKAGLLLDNMAQTRLEGLSQSLRAAIQAALEETDLDLPNFDIGDQVRLAGVFDLTNMWGGVSKENRRIVNEVLSDYAALALAADSSVEEQATALDRLVTSFRSAAEASGEVSGAELAEIERLEGLLLRVYELQAQLPSEDGKAQSAQRAWAQYYAMRVRGENEVGAATREAYQGAFRESIAALVERGVAWAEDLQSANAIRAELEEQANLLRLIGQYGEDSAAVSEARADIERRVFEEMLATLDVSAGLKDELRAAFEKKIAVANVDISSDIWDAANAASQLAANLAAARAQGIADLSQAQIAWDYRDDPVGRAGAVAGKQFDTRLGDTSGLDPILKEGLAQQRAEYVANAEAVETLRQKTAEYAKLQSQTGGSGRRGGQGSSRAAREERDAVADLIGELQGELDILRETDPVQQELLRHRETLAEATAAQRARVEELISVTHAEREAMEQAAEMRDFFGDATLEALDAVILRGGDAKDAIDSLTDALMKAALQALWLGEGPLAGLFGTSEDGGLFGLIGGLFSPAKKADGGWAENAAGTLYGPGGGRDDRLPHLLSAGEFVVNAKSAARHRALLEAINAGEHLVGLATGGPALGGAAPRAMAAAVGPAQAGRLVLEVAPSAEFDVRIRESTAAAGRALLDQYDSDQLPVSIRRISADPRRIG